MTETIPAMRDRHSLEIMARVTAEMDSGATQAQASRNLGLTQQDLSNYLKRNSMAWPFKAPGRKRETAQ